MKSLIQVLSTILLAVIVAVGLQIGSANAQTNFDPAVNYESTIINGEEFKTPNLVNTSAVISLKNLNSAQTPTISYVVSSTTDSCSKGPGTFTGSQTTLPVCQPSGQPITVKNTTDATTQGFAPLQVSITNY
ncbi:hypothetical protein NIES4074_56010 [Cylindrospermum sp. NIES-4074]|nr:hypothetical protein NIES4074_56010 [Cylindrospermum sp. NIES-4074]